MREELVWHRGQDGCRVEYGSSLLKSQNKNTGDSQNKYNKKTGSGDNEKKKHTPSSLAILRASMVTSSGTSS